MAFGPARVISAELDDIAGINEAYVSGSWAARYSGEAGAAPNDVDILVVGDPDRNDVYEAAMARVMRLVSFNGARSLSRTGSFTLQCRCSLGWGA